MSGFNDLFLLSQSDLFILNLVQDFQSILKAFNRLKLYLYGSGCHPPIIMRRMADCLSIVQDQISREMDELQSQDRTYSTVFHERTYALFNRISWKVDDISLVACQSQVVKEQASSLELNELSICQSQTTSQFMINIFLFSKARHYMKATHYVSRYMAKVCWMFRFIQFDWLKGPWKTWQNCTVTALNGIL